MEDFNEFNEFWDLYNPEPCYNNRLAATCLEWQKCSQKKRDAILSWLRTNRPPDNRNPYFFVQDFREPRQQILSFADYYNRYGTTEDTDGWHKENPTGEKVIFVKD